MTTADWKLLIYGVVAGVLVTLTASHAIRSRATAGRMLAGVALGWLVPGAGHVWLGRVRKGLFLFALITGLFGAGCVLAGGRTVTFDENPFYSVGHIGSGLTLGVHEWLAADAAPPRNVPALPLVDPGLLYMSVAGLLNLLLVMNVFDVLDDAPAGGAPSAAGPAPPGAADSPAAAPPPGKEKAG